jgi:hypothetical protein
MIKTPTLPLLLVFYSFLPSRSHDNHYIYHHNRPASLALPTNFDTDDTHTRTPYKPHTRTPYKPHTRTLYKPTSTLAKMSCLELTQLASRKWSIEPNALEALYELVSDLSAKECVVLGNKDSPESMIYCTKQRPQPVEEPSFAKTEAKAREEIRRLDEKMGLERRHSSDESPRALDPDLLRATSDETTSDKTTRKSTEKSMDDGTDTQPIYAMTELQAIRKLCDSGRWLVPLDRSFQVFQADRSLQGESVSPPPPYASRLSSSQPAESVARSVELPTSKCCSNCPNCLGLAAKSAATTAMLASPAPTTLASPATTRTAITAPVSPTTTRAAPTATAPGNREKRKRGSASAPDGSFSSRSTRVA